MSHGIRHSRSQGLIDFAYDFAKQAHHGQFRKYTGEPYIVHPVEVAQIVASVTDDCECIATALLHDVIEDCGVSHEMLDSVGFRKTIADMVLELSDISKPCDGNRAVRKLMDAEHLGNVRNKSKTVKLADLISNSKSIIENDPKFSKVYMAEKRQLLPHLKGGDETLFKRCEDIINDYYRG